MQQRLLEKLARICANPAGRDFLLADAKAPDMAFGIQSLLRSGGFHPGRLAGGLRINFKLAAWITVTTTRRLSHRAAGDSGHQFEVDCANAPFVVEHADERAGPLRYRKLAVLGG